MGLVIVSSHEANKLCSVRHQQTRCPETSSGWDGKGTVPSSRAPLPSSPH
jgi:hypothetical protein